MKLEQPEDLSEWRSTIGAIHRDPMQPGAILLGSAETAGRVALIETVEEPGGEPPCHRHHWEDTLLYVLAGALNVYLAGQWIDAPAGAAVWVPRGVEHTYVVTDEHTRVLTLFTPAGFEGFYRELDAPRPWRCDLECLVAMAARYGCELTAPHPGPPAARRRGDGIEMKDDNPPSPTPNPKPEGGTR